MTDDIELPPLPPDVQRAVFHDIIPAGVIEAYALAAIKADREKRGAAPQVQQEPVRLGALLDEYLHAGHEAYKIGRETERVSRARRAIVDAFHAAPQVQHVAPPTARLTAEVIDNVIMPMADKQSDAVQFYGYKDWHAIDARAALRAKLLEFTK